MLRALDLFCGAGGASMGLHRAGFDVTGVDIKPQPRYPFKFIQADALEFPLEGYDFIWASPPCQAFTRLKHLPWVKDKEHPNLIPGTRDALIQAGVPFVIENVEGSPLGDTGFLIMLCGTMFGLGTANGRAELRRHRLFETSFSIPLRPACQHGAPVFGWRIKSRTELRPSAVLTVTGHTPVDQRVGISVTGSGQPVGSRRRAISVTGNTAQTNTIRNRQREVFTTEQAREAMGIDWMPMSGLSQAIPPAYSEFIGKQAIQYIQQREVYA